MFKKIALISCLLFFVFSFSTVIAEANINENSQNEETYKMLYEEIKDTNARILDTVYFALTFAAGFILLFLGSNAWFASRSRKKESEALKNENAKQILEIRQEMSDNFDSLQRKNLEVLEENIKEKFEDLRKLDESYENLRNGFYFELNSLKGDLAFQKGEFHTALDLSFIEAKDSWEYSKPHDIYDFYLAEALEKMDKILQKMGYIDQNKYGEISTFLKELPEKYLATVQNLNTTLENIEKSPY